jgi:glycine dehydrogenase subunit 1
MKYIPQSSSDQTALLSKVGVQSVDELFEAIPKQHRLPKKIDYPRAHSEFELRKKFKELLAAHPRPTISFAGCGIYQHDVPSIVPTLQMRSEFATSYTPYQPEISQGTLQCIFEYQTLACQLTETELSNASLYDGATSLGEAVLMAVRIQKKTTSKIWMPDNVHPNYQEVVRSYSDPFKERLADFASSSGRIDAKDLRGRLEEGDILITQSPNVFGLIEDDEEIGRIVKERGAFWISSTMEPLVWGLLRGPGAFGAHIVTGEGSSFGNGPYLGGSSFGIFCTRNEYLRNLPGRLVGETLDEEGRRSYTLTFATREQFIRRGRATSNICTNNNLNMLAGLFHLASLGKVGMRELAQINFSKAEFAKSTLKKAGVGVLEGPTFNEFTCELSIPAAQVVRKAAEESWVVGVDLGRFKDSWKHRLLIHVSEMHSKEDIQKMAAFVGAMSK